ncbi:MAG TPA: DUF4160 domain-containing protein [Virgibacillus sp.]|nr:DUF4160 domain-containing protein [Virgibacillus sp.]HLR67564.1 DUF4160 domain-containing protein [Virgibacillus sp.]
MTIVIYYNDHKPPHFHIIYNEINTRIEIETGMYMKGNSPLPKPKEKDVLKWLDIYRTDIIKVWEDCMAKRQPIKIPPLY